MLIKTIVFLATLTGPLQAGSSGGNQFLLVGADSAHTLFTPNAPDAGRVGQVY
jgi:hypothetical protein